MMAPLFIYDRLVSGMFTVYVAEPRVRIGVVSGRSGSWLAETPAGWAISRYRTRRDAALALFNQARIERRVGDGVRRRAEASTKEGR